MLTARTFILSPEWRRMEGVLLRDAGFYPLGGQDGGADAGGEIARLAPDLLILDSVLPGIDALALLDALASRMASPPRILYLNRMGNSASAEAALGKGVDALLRWPAEDADFLRAAKGALRPLPGLAAASQERRLAVANELLDTLAMAAHLKGRHYMAHAAAMAACAPTLLSALTDEMYPLLAGQFSTTPAAVERAIRTAIESTWLRGDLSAIQRLFGFSVDADRGKPTNAEFLSMLAQHVRQRL